MLVVSASKQAEICNACLVTHAVDDGGEADVPAQLPLGEVPLHRNGHQEGLQRRPRDLQRRVHQLRRVLYQRPLVN